MAELFKHRVINFAYPEVVAVIMRTGDLVPSRVSKTREMHPAILSITDTNERLVTSFGRPVNVAFALAEVLWILAGSNEVDMLAHYNSKIAEYSDNGTTFNAAYGHRLRTAHGHDQLLDAIETLRHDPGSRQVVLNINLPAADRGWRPEQVITNASVPEYQDVKHITKDRACNVMSLLKIRDDKLDWLQLIRSNDAIHGLPYNLMQWLHLQAWMAAAIGVEPGQYNHVVDSLHIYDYHWDEVEKIRFFDLYRTLEREHRPFTPADTTEQALATVLAVEHAIRAGTEPLRYIEVPGGGYWFDVLTILQAHMYYKQGLDNQCLQTLLEGDQVLGLGAARFYYYHRWHKPEYAELLEHLKGEIDPLVASWITDTHA